VRFPPFLIYTIKDETIKANSHPKETYPPSHKNPTCQVGATQKSKGKPARTKKMSVSNCFRRFVFFWSPRAPPYPPIVPTRFACLITGSKSQFVSFLHCTLSSFFPPFLIARFPPFVPPFLVACFPPFLNHDLFPSLTGHHALSSFCSSFPHCVLSSFPKSRFVSFLNRSSRAFRLLFLLSSLHAFLLS
jgi:hypothetical protein